MNSAAYFAAALSPHACREWELFTSTIYPHLPSYRNMQRKTSLRVAHP
jgi:hypothetical protein